LGERKEFLSQGEQEELLALVDFAHKRTIDKLEAQAALDRYGRRFLACYLTHEYAYKPAPRHSGQTGWQPV
jgi:hypothetical protein